MDSIQISTGKKIMVNGDPSRVISFDPNDVNFAERFYALMQDFQAKQEGFSLRAQALDEKEGIDALPEGISFIKEVCQYMRDHIDRVFGAGTSKAAFGDSMSLDAIEEFFQGITPFIQQAREQKMTRYLNQKNAGKVME